MDSVSPINKNTESSSVSRLQMQSQLINRLTSTSEWSQVDSVQCIHYSIKYYELCSTALSIILRLISICINGKLAFTYYINGNMNYFLWTIMCMAIPMVITILIHANMCHQDGEFNRGTCRSLQTLWCVFLTSFLFRYWKSLCYAITCKTAERKGEKEVQLKYYKLSIREDSDVAFIRLFECFLEAAPQKILQISIVLGHADKITNIQIVAICSYFGSMAWCLAAYHRCNRYAQIDKNKINTHGLVLQLCWHFCISVSRTLCIAFIASLFPLWTLLACLFHAIVLGATTFLIDRPQFAASSTCNFLFCLVLGIIYLFTYITIKDGPTKLKYSFYYLISSTENILCVALFIIFASKDLKLNYLLFYTLCAMAIAFYYIGVVFMIIYYLYFHPKITCRASKRLMNNS